MRRSLTKSWVCPRKGFVVIPQKRLDTLIQNLFDSRLKKWKKNPKEPADFTKALALLSYEELLAGSCFVSHNTVCGYFWESLVYIIASENKSFEVNAKGTNKPDGQIRDITVIHKIEIPEMVNGKAVIRKIDKTYRIHGQSKGDTKNGTGQTAIDADSIGRESVTVQAVVQGLGKREYVKGEKGENILVLQGPELFRWLTSTNLELDNGDPKLYDRIIKSLKRLRK